VGAGRSPLPRPSSHAALPPSSLQLIDEVYYDNFKRAKEDEERRAGARERGGGGGRGRGRGGAAPGLPPGVMLVPAGPGGALVPVVPLGMAGPLGGGGRGGGRGRGLPGRGGPPRGPSYVDLDSPANQRSVLDYGDL